jgi:hypothetical protein
MRTMNPPSAATADADLCAKRSLSATTRTRLRCRCATSAHSSPGRAWVAQECTGGRRRGAAVGFRDA